MAAPAGAVEDERIAVGVKHKRGSPVVPGREGPANARRVIVAVGISGTCADVLEQDVRGEHGQTERIGPASAWTPRRGGSAMTALRPQVRPDAARY